MTVEAGDLHDPARLHGQNLEDDEEPTAPEQVLAEMRGVVEPLRRQLQAGLPADRAAPPGDEAGDQESGV